MPQKSMSDEPLFMKGVILIPDQESWLHNQMSFMTYIEIPFLTKPFLIIRDGIYEVQRDKVIAKHEGEQHIDKVRIFPFQNCRIELSKSSGFYFIRIGDKRYVHEDGTAEFIVSRSATPFVEIEKYSYTTLDHRTVTKTV